jgi:fermentation-respiration switch protein FrsA (DUF1100 family)
MYWYLTAILLFIFAAAGSFHLSGMIIKPKVKSRESILRSECEKNNMDKEAFDRLHKEEFKLMSQYGYELHGYFFPNNDSKKTVIICHGITVNLFCSVKYMDMFLKRGFNVLIYDHRNHGKSGGSNTTFGYYEKYDLKACTDWVYKRCGNNSLVGLHGESMGAAIALQNAAIDPRIAFCVADCSFSDLTMLLRYRLKVEYRLPFFPAMQLADLFVRLRTGMKLKDISPLRDVSNIEAPVFFIHGMDDLYILPQMSIDMYRAKKGIKMLYLAPNARHADAFTKNRDEYDRLIGEFLDAIPIHHP